ncbi:hypothetical protein [Coralloluteibacterium thermophilus]|uniref:Uncharacterized protein n=1 Tax=Coralloluteibacterium thermophilum TaxID=2707049 RepID=A0ABV9NJK6_9GAMM
MTRLGLRMCIQSALIATCVLMCVSAATGGMPWLALLALLGAVVAVVELLGALLIVHRVWHRTHPPRQRRTSRAA